MSSELFPSVASRSGSAPPWPAQFLRNFRPQSSLRIVALTWGSRGDVQPFVALGVELARRGHRFTIAARAPYRAFIEEHGLQFFEMEDDDTEGFMRDLASADGISASLIARIATSRRALMKQQFSLFWRATEGADVIISNSAFTAPALHIAEHRGIPIFQTFFDPGFVPTRRYCSLDNRLQDRGPVVNLAAAHARSLAQAFVMQDIVVAWRKERRMPLDLSGIRHFAPLGSRLPVLAAWSPALVERPDDWPAWFAQTGRWRVPSTPQVDERLLDFMASGPTPVYMGFGSWGVHDKTAVTDIVLEALRITGDRAVLLAGMVDTRRSFPEHVYVSDDLPHDWLFPRVKAVVHHGGAGTAGAVTTAGVPGVVIPAFFAQAVWGDIAIRKGIGTMLPSRELGAERLAAALRAVDQPAVRAQAREVGECARRDGGEAYAADFIAESLGVG